MVDLLTDKTHIIDNRLSMKGKIRTKEKCQSCQGNFQAVQHPITKDHIDLMCPSCRTRPLYYFIDARDMKAGKIYKNKRGQLFDSFLAAHRQLEEMRGEIDNHTFDPEDWVPKRLQEFKFRDVAKKWIERIERDKSYSYVRHCKSYLEHHIKRELGDIDVRDIRTSHIEDLYLKLIEKKLSPKTIDGILSTLQTLINRLHYLDLITRVPKFPLVKVPQTAKGWINREKQKAVLSHIPERHRLIFETLKETAERPGEVCAHKKKDLIDGEICIERAFDERGNFKEEKTGKVIYRGISLALWNKLAEQAKDKLPEAWLFLDEFGKPYSQDRLYRIWKRATKAAGMQISLYAGTRHSRASQKRLEKEKEIAEACRKELGHSKSLTTMKHYARDRREEL